MRFYILRILSVMFVLLCSIGAAADIRWLSTEYDFGSFKEIQGRQTGVLRFVNLGPDTIMINRVRVSCGCTDAGFTEGLIAPGDTAAVRVTYNPAGRPGRFEKSVRVYTGADNRITVLWLKGTVIGAPESLKERYPIEAGPLRLSQNQLIGGEVAFGKSSLVMFTGYNQTADTIRPHWDCASQATKVDISSKAVPPGDLVTFSVYFTPRNADDMGFHTYDITLYPDKGKTNAAKVVFTANVVPDISGLTAEQIADAPRITLYPQQTDMGELRPDAKARFSFVIGNDGHAELRILRITAQSDAVKFLKFPSVVKPGKKATAEAEIEVSKIKAPAFGIKIEVSSTDPVHPAETIRVSGLVNR